MLKYILLTVKEGPVFRVLDLNFRVKSVIITVQIWPLRRKLGLICRSKTLIFTTQIGLTFNGKIRLNFHSKKPYF